jgi:hypothetical protein
MIKTLLQSGGEATTEEIATSLLAYDQSQVEYYSLRTNAMVGKVLTNNGVVSQSKMVVRLQVIALQKPPTQRRI